MITTNTEVKEDKEIKPASDNEDYQSLINKFPAIQLKDLNNVVPTYTMQNFSYKKEDLPCILLLFPNETSTTGHYVAMATNDNKLYYFDSYGNNPVSLFEKKPEMDNKKQDLKQFGDFINEFKNNINYNDIKLQSENSNICGLYCLCYIYLFKSHKQFTPTIFGKTIQHLSKRYKVPNDLIILTLCDRYDLLKHF